MNLWPQQPPVGTPFPRCPPQPPMAPTVAGSNTPVLSGLQAHHGHATHGPRPPLTPWGAPATVEAHGVRGLQIPPSKSPSGTLCSTAKDSLLCAMCVLSHFTHSPPGSSVHGVLQARILEWVVISCFRGSSPPRDQTLHLLPWPQALSNPETTLCSSIIPALSPCEDPIRHQERET